MSAEHKHPRLIPVLDVMNGEVVRAVGGRRDEYRPIQSRMMVSTMPTVVAGNLLHLARAAELYIADLDAIRGGSEVSPAIVRAVQDWKVRVWVDIGINARRPASLLAELPNARPVVALETGATPADVQQTFAVSVDLKGGKLLGKWSDWGAAHSGHALAVARTAIRAGASTLIVLDLARVGTGTGTGTEPLLEAIRAEFPDVDLIAGGGVRTWDDIDRLGDAGATGVLVASALHDGTLRVPRTL